MRSVMVVDDDDGVRECVSEVLREEGFEVLEARDGEEALQLLHDGARPVVIISDARMPGLDGYELRAAMMQDERLSTIPFVLASATPNRATAESAGVTAYLDKPFGAEKLVRAVRRHVPRTSAPPRERQSSPGLF